jgi:hypothetical protein
VPYTANCDLYAAVNEVGLNLIARHIMRQRPSLFNYASAYVAQHPRLACAPVDATSDVYLYKNPLFTVEPPLPLLGTDAPPVALNYSAQLTKAEVDFHPGNVITLPAEMNPPLAAQHFAMTAGIDAGIICAWDELGSIEPWAPGQKPGSDRPTPPSSPPEVPAGGPIDCFHLDGFVIGHASIQQPFGPPTLFVEVDAVDVPDIAPPGMKAAIDCYLRDTIQMVLREKLNFPLVHTFFFDFAFLHLPNITVVPAPNPPVPNNPAIEDNQLKIFIDFEVGP